MEQELVPVVGESLGSAVNHEAENGDSKVGELLPGSDKSEGAVEEPRPEKKGFFARAAEWNWKNIFIAAVLWLGYFFVNTAYSTIELFFPNEAADQGASPIVIGVIISAAPLCEIVVSPLIGYFLPHLGVRFTLLSGLWLVGGAYTLLSFVASMPAGWVFIMFCILLRFTEGAGSAMFETSVFALVPRLFPDNAGTLTGIMEVGAGLGFVVGPPIGGVLYGAGGFRLPFLVVGGICLALLPVIFLLIPQSDCEKRLLSFRALAKLLTKFHIFLLAMANMLSLAALAFFTPIFQPFLTHQFNLSPQKLGLVFLSAPIVYVIVALLVGKLVDKLGPRWFTISGFLIEGVAFFLIGPGEFIAKPKIWLTAVAYGLVGLGAAFCLVSIYLNLLCTAKSLDEDEDKDAILGVVAGISSASLSFGEIVGPLVGGALTEAFSFQTSAVVFGEFLLAEGSLLLGVALIDWRFGT